MGMFSKGQPAIGYAVELSQKANPGRLIESASMCVYERERERE
jgi:hypothetical protein